jgi:hypothetical protein
MEYAEKKGIDSNDLPERLLVDKELVVKLDEAKMLDEKGINELYQNARVLKQGIEELRITDGHLKKDVNPMALGFKLLMYLILLNTVSLRLQRSMKY